MVFLLGIFMVGDLLICYYKYRVLIDTKETRFLLKYQFLIFLGSFPCIKKQFPGFSTAVLFVILSIEIKSKSNEDQIYFIKRNVRILHI